MTVLTHAATTQWLHVFAAEIAENESALTDLDAAIGDADHGSNMRRGTEAVLANLAAQQPASISETLRSAAMTLISTVGGASGVLYGTLLLRMASASADRTEISAADVASAWRAGLDGVRARGQAELGDKTMVDVLVPAIDAMDSAVASGASLAEAAESAAEAALAARDATAPLVASRGRASYLGERSAGHIDPGAASSALLVAAFAHALHDTAGEARS